MNRPDGDPARSHTVAPGMHEFRVPGPEPRTPGAKYSVAWWDPRVLHLGATASFGLRRDDLIVKDGDMFAVEERLVAYERWRAERDTVIATARQPSLQVHTATTWAAEAASSGLDYAIAEASAIEVVALPGSADRPRGPRFGTLVHAVLATVPFDAEEDLIARTAAMHGRLLIASADEIRAAAVVASSVLASPLMRRARGASAVRRETPITWLQEDGTLIEGVLDLAFDEGDTTIVVDFKTDHELAAGESRYRAQVQQYVNAVARATGRAARGVLFKV